MSNAFDAAFATHVDRNRTFASRRADVLRRAVEGLGRIGTGRAVSQLKSRGWRDLSNPELAIVHTYCA